MTARRYHVRVLVAEMKRRNRTKKSTSNKGSIKTCAFTVRRESSRHKSYVPDEYPAQVLGALTDMELHVSPDTENTQQTIGHLLQRTLQ